jgi:hypothetical protein
VGSRGSVTAYSYHTEATKTRERAASKFETVSNLEISEETSAFPLFPRLVSEDRPMRNTCFALSEIRNAPEHPTWHLEDREHRAQTFAFSSEKGFFTLQRLVVLYIKAINGCLHATEPQNMKVCLQAVRQAVTRSRRAMKSKTA